MLFGQAVAEISRIELKVPPNQEKCVEINKASKKILFSGSPTYMRFFIGDDNGFVKSLRIPRIGVSATESPVPLEPSVVLRPTESHGKENSIERLAIRGDTPDKMYLVTWYN